MGLAGALIAILFWGGYALALGGLLGGLLGWSFQLHRRVQSLEQRLNTATVQPTAETESAPASNQQPRPQPKPDAPAVAASGSPSSWNSPLSEGWSDTSTDASEKDLDSVLVELPDLPEEVVSAPTAEPQAAQASRADWPQALRRLFTDGNLVVRLGLLVLFFGVAFLLKYAAEHAVFPIELRLSAAALGGLVLAGIGWRLRQRRRGFALLMQGGGIGIFYLVVFAATALYGLLPTLLALLLMLALVGLLVLLALWQDSQSLAVFAISGGFLAPVLASTGSGSHVLLFSYYALLNLVVLALAWFRAWRALNLLGFVFTFIIGSLWGVTQYRPEHYASTQPFLIFFFLLYLAVAILFALRQPLQQRGYVDAGLLFGVPIVGFALQAALVHRMEYGLAFSALALGTVYLLLARLLWQRQVAGMRLFTEALLALGVIFGTLAIPLALDGQWTAAAWAMEGAAMLWLGLRQQRLPVRLFGIALQLLAGVFFFLGSWYRPEALPVFNSVFFGGLLLALAGLLSAWLLQRDSQDLRHAERPLHGLMLGWGLLWWLGAGLAEIDRHVPAADTFAAGLIYVGLSTALGLWLWRRLPWSTLRWPLFGLLPLLWLWVIPDHSRIDAPWLQGLALLAWPLVFAVQYRLLWRLQDALPAWSLRLSHAATLWLILLLLAHDAWAWVSQWLGSSSAWTWAAPAWPLLLALALLPGLAPRLHLGPWAKGYQGEALVPLALGLLLWFLLASSHPAGSAPLPWLPILNPLELTQLLSLMALALWLSRPELEELSARVDLSLPGLWALWGGFAFVLLNTVLAHAAHHWAGVAWDAQALFDSGRLQTSVSVAWTLSALVVGWWATRKRWRGMWFVAAGLIGLVVLKLFLIDLADSGTIERIVSFIAVGVLMLLMGYVAPLPPPSSRPPVADADNKGYGQ
jgi:uncharacterized membrane protein